MPVDHLLKFEIRPQGALEGPGEPPGPTQGNTWVPMTGLPLSVGDPVWGDETGAELDSTMVRSARQEEVAYETEIGLYNKMPPSVGTKQQTNQSQMNRHQYG